MSAYLYRIAAYLLLAFAPIQLVYADFIAPEIVSGYLSIYQPEKEGFFDNLGACKSWVEEGAFKAYYLKDHRWEGGKCPYPSRPSDISCHLLYLASHSENDRETLGGCKVKRKCPSHSKQNEDNTCTCLSGYFEKNGSCVKPEEQKCEAGKKTSFSSKGHSPTTTCIASCEYKAVDVEICVRLPGENLRCSIDMVSTGKECKEPTPTKPNGFAGGSALPPPLQAWITTLLTTAF